MGIVHYDVVLQKTVDIILNELSGDSRSEIYIVQNVYGKILVYLNTERKELVLKFDTILKDKIGSWLGGCEAYGDNFFVISEIERWKKQVVPIENQIWIFEKYLTNAYWDGQKKNNYKTSIKSKLVSFYSFKGGVGRTTAVVMSAIELAKQGKKVVIIDFDLEAPGIASLFPDEAMSQYGLLDFLIESNVYEEEINIDEYVYPVGEYCKANQMGGDIYIMPAYGKVTHEKSDMYRKSLMRFDLDLPAYEEKYTPIDALLVKLDKFLNPNFIFIDTRSGIHQIGGMTLTRYSDLALLFFYGSKQNIEGMKMTIPILKSNEIPFILINSKVPVNEELAELEKQVYLDGSYEALRLCDDRYYNNEILLEDESAEHFPIDIAYNMALEVIGSTEQLVRAWEDQRSEYIAMANVIADVLPEEVTAPKVLASEDENEQEKIIEAFADTMGGLETAAAEDEFATEQDLINKFYPLKGYTFIFDPRKFLVLGQKGVGKTALFSALKNNEYAKALAKYLNVSTEHYEHTEWVVGTSQMSNYVDIFRCLEGEEQIRAFVYYKTVDILIQHDASLKDIIKDKNILSLLDSPFEPGNCNLLTGKMAYGLNELLKKMNNHYQKLNKVVTIIYDSLDRIVAPKDRNRFISTLIDIWYMNESTMQNIRSKIFLRKDIYDREVVVSDKVKLKNYSTTIGWEYDQLFALVWKRAISNSQQVKELFEQATIQHIKKTSGLGYIPIVSEKENREMLGTLIGVKMGSGNKASTYNWFRNRLADTQGIIVPRSMIDIFAKAANREMEFRDGKTFALTKSIIRPRYFEDVLPEVSDKRVIDLKEEYKEYEVFLESLKDTVQRSPVDEKTLIAALSGAGFDNPREEIKNLINIGILKQYQRKLSDPIRYHFPDIYLRGLGLQRSGMR